MKTRKELQNEIAAKKAAIKAFCDGIGERAFTEDEQTKANEFEAEYKGLLEELTKCQETEDRMKLLRDLGGGITPSEKELVQGGKGFNLGKAFVEHEQFKAWLKSVKVGDSLMDSDVPASPPIGFKTLLTGASDTSAGAFVQTDYTGIYEPLGRAPLSILNLVARGTTGSDLVEFVRQTAKITQAANVQEANVATYSGATGEISGSKPEATMTFEQATQAVNSIAAWIPATRRAIADAGQLMSLINTDLQDDLKENLEYEMVDGSGAGAHFYGIQHTPNVLTYAWNTDVLRTTREAITYLRVTGRTIPTAWLMNPADWEDIDLEQDSNNRYYFGGPTQLGVKTLWGVPVVECEHVDEGTAILGNFRKAMLWDREAATIRVSEHHSDYFIRNMIAVLGELRCAFAVIRPTAFCLVAVESGT